MNIKRSLLLVLLSVPGSLLAKEKSDISVMTQNQYLGASLVPIISAENPVSRNEALIATLIRIQENETPVRISALAETIAERQPHFVGLQEVENSSCISVSTTIPDACALFEGAFNDHLQLTTDALSMLGADYQVLATVENLNIASAYVFIDEDLAPDISISITDRDAILVRGDIGSAQATNFTCSQASLDGCNYTNNFSVGGLPIPRGFVGVDATIDGHNYRFVNTHLEIPFALTDAKIPVQALQAEELLNALSGTPDNWRVIIVGDFNSSPEDVYSGNPYMQMLAGNFTDTWNQRPGKQRPGKQRPGKQRPGKQRPGKRSGYTCCQDSDLSNIESAHDTRIDHVFTSPKPHKMKSKVLDNKPDDKTASHLWPSDHSSVSVRMKYK